MLQKEEAIGLLSVSYESQREPSGVYTAPDPEALLDLLHEIMDLFSTTSVVIDGIDEIERDRWETIDLLRLIRWENCKTRTIYASRRETEIEDCLTEYDKVQ